MHWIARRVFRIRLDVNRPLGGLERHDFHWNHVRAWIDDSRDVLPIPVHHNRHLIPVRWRRTPIARPGTDQRVTLLNKCEENERRKNDFSEHQGTIRLLRSTLSSVP